MKRARAKIKQTALRMFGMPSLAELEEAEVDPEGFIEHFKESMTGRSGGWTSRLGG